MSKPRSFEIVRSDMRRMAYLNWASVGGMVLLLSLSILDIIPLLAAQVLGGVLLLFYFVRLPKWKRLRDEEAAIIRGQK